MPITKILIQSSSREVIDAATEVNIPDVSVEPLMLKCEFDGGMLFAAIVTLASGIGINLLSQWLYDKVKSNPNEKTVINGNQLFAENVQMIQIIQVIDRQTSSSEDKSKTDCPLSSIKRDALKRAP